MATAEWFAATAVAEPARAPRPRRQPTRATPAPRARPRSRAKRRIRAHIVWMVAFALLLAGIVAVNVAVLRANVAVNKLDEQRAQIEARNEALASELSAASSVPKVEAAARRLGLVQAPAAATTYFTLVPRGR